MTDIPWVRILSGANEIGNKLNGSFPPQLPDCIRYIVTWRFYNKCPGRGGLHCCHLLHFLRNMTHKGHPPLIEVGVTL